MFPKETQTTAFKERVDKICSHYINISGGKFDDNTCYYSSDEKTGIQAKSRTHSRAVKKGYVEKMESEYQRNGTQCLIAGKDLVSGKIESYTIGDTRKEEDYLQHIQDLVRDKEGKKHVIFCDQLNTHKSASLVKWIAKTIGLKEDLGEKGKSGILRSQHTRQEFLEDENHRIRFIYTPKHCSWINQIENWFSIIQKKVIKRGNFPTIGDLKQKIISFIEYYNNCLSKPMIWKSKCEKLLLKKLAI